MSPHYLISTVDSLDRPPRSHWMLIGSSTIVLWGIWAAFLVFLTISRFHHPQVPYLSGSTWFELPEGMFVIIPFLCPAILAYLPVLFDRPMIRDWQAAFIIAGLERRKPNDLLPPADLKYMPLPFDEMSRDVKEIYTAERAVASSHFTLWKAISSILSIAAICASGVVSITHEYLGGNQPIDLIVPIASATILIALPVWLILTLFQGPTTAHIDESGLTFPIPRHAKSRPPISWDSIAAIYLVESAPKYWLLFADDRVYGWSSGLRDLQNNAAQLALAIARRKGLPVLDATPLFEFALDPTSLRDPRVTALLASSQGQEVLTTMQMFARRRRFSLWLSAALAVAGLTLGCIATIIIAQVAANSPF